MAEPVFGRCRTEQLQMQLLGLVHYRASMLSKGTIWCHFYCPHQKAAQLNSFPSSLGQLSCTCDRSVCSSHVSVLCLCLMFVEYVSPVCQLFFFSDF